MKVMEARSFSFQAVDADRDGRRNDERAQHWGRIFRSWEGSICRHNFTGIACQECRWKVDYCFSIRFASPCSASVFIKWTKMERELYHHVDQLLGCNLSFASDYSVYGSIYVCVCMYCIPILHLTSTYAFMRVRTSVSNWTAIHLCLPKLSLSIFLLKLIERTVKITELILPEKRENSGKSFFHQGEIRRKNALSFQKFEINISIKIKVKILSFHLIFNFDILCEVIIIATLNHKISKKDPKELEIYYILLSERNWETYGIWWNKKIDRELN